MIFLWLSSGIFTAVFTGVVLWWLRRAQIWDIPNDRSNHQRPVPRGGGIAVVGTVLAFLWVSGAPAVLMLSLLILVVISFMDDRAPLPAWVRFAVQVVAVSVALSLVEIPWLAVYLPFGMDRVCMALVWLWCINLFNFMDGIDGISAMQWVCLGLGVYVLSSFAPATVAVPSALVLDAGLMAAALAGFIVWNWHPARVFLGDVGSVPLGFFMGYILLSLVQAGHTAPAAILPAYYVVDATVTLLRRALQGKNILQPHSEHGYQRAVRAGWSHAQVVWCITGLNAVLIGLVLTVVLQPKWAIEAVAAAYGLSVLLWWYLYTRKQPAGKNMDEKPPRWASDDAASAASVASVDDDVSVKGGNADA